MSLFVIHMEQEDFYSFCPINFWIEFHNKAN